ncbi:MAG: hypothetical protein ABI679_01315 [Gemmatimonadota bacterium]
MTLLSRLRWVLALAGMVFALVGIAMSDSRIVWAAIAILSVALLVGLYLKKHRDQAIDQ